MPDIIFTPECLNVITSNKNHLKKVATTQNNCPVLYECKNFAKEHNIFVSVGSLLLKQNNSEKLLNRSFFINNKGKILSVLAAVTKHSKVRQLFGRTIGLFSAG